MSHQTLMLRSTARFAGDDTIDVWFDGVAASNLRHSFQPLTIRAAEAGERERMIEFAGADLYDPVGRPPLRGPCGLPDRLVIPASRMYTGLSAIEGTVICEQPGSRGVHNLARVGD